MKTRAAGCAWTLGVLLAPALASASPEADVDAIVRATIDHVADAKCCDAFAKGAFVVGRNANIFEWDTTNRVTGEHAEQPLDFKTHGKLWAMLFYGDKPDASQKLGKLSVAVDAAGKTAWFQGPMTMSGSRELHVSGEAVLDGSAWKLRVLTVELAVTDKECSKHVVLAPKIAWTDAAPSTDFGKALVAWIGKHGLAKHVAQGALASGSAPGELAKGPDASKLAAAFDHLWLIPTYVVADDATGFAYGLTWTPVDANGDDRDGVTEYAYTAYGVKDGTDWKWMSLQFACDRVPEI